MSMIVLSNVDIFDGVSPEIMENHHVVIADGRIKEITHREVQLPGAHHISGQGKTLMPGLIDAHYHACLVQVQGYNMTTLPPSLLYPAASNLLENSLQRGFTSVRDAGGADFGLAEATRTGLIKGPRIFYSGRPLTQTGGHGEMRAKVHEEPCLCASHQAHMVAVVDGEDAVRKAVREEFRKGADQIKIMLNGGVSTDADPVWLCQFTDDEIRAAVDEAERRRSYVMAHVYLDKQIRKAVELGIRTMEHGNFLTLDTARYMAEKGAFLVPTLVTYQAIREKGRAFGFNDEQFRKLDAVSDAGLQSLENAMAGKVNIGFGTDLLGDMHVHQSDEFLIRSAIQTPFEILKSATSVNAEILNRTGDLGVVAEGAYADLLLVEGNPLEDITLLTGDGCHLAMVMKDGKVMSK
ncbi:metal-dependent hydrolase family protein [Paremcibacter congregatus]|uniref:Peptidase M38 n=1 Tax=Paremcibacter congregatus TaxID=2043170 RepID=A0A2G4YUF5_9PROT|nr:amidohydrolase family protein [Paremcibacter congregatus]PHZ85880.1 peptidase M38 [Paremcibacter congregatus]QDE26844.1 amidohydrolase family protein [Paremcibacter congregatus]